MKNKIRVMPIIQGNTSPVVRVRPVIDGEAHPLDDWVCRMVLFHEDDKAASLVDKLVVEKSEDETRFLCYLEPLDTAHLELGNYVWGFELSNEVLRPRMNIEKVQQVRITEQWAT